MRIRFVDAIIHNHYLIRKLAGRELKSRYRGSLLGWGWSLLQPLSTLTIYTLIFSQILKTRWGAADGGSGIGDYSVNLFAGLITFGVFSECTNKSPDLVTRQVSYVKKVVFPLEILSISMVSSVLLNTLASLAILLLFELIIYGKIPWTVVMLPMVWLPLAGLTLGCSWILAALGVYIRDTVNIISVGTSLLMFLSAVIYPISALPEKWQGLIRINPMVEIIEQTRRVMVTGLSPSARYLILGTAATLIFCEVSYRFFMKARKGFADVL